MNSDESETGTVSDRVRSIIATQLGRPLKEVVPSSRIVDDLGADSLDVAELLLVLEEAFRAEIPNERASNLVTVRDVIAVAEGIDAERRLASAEPTTAV